MVLVNGGFLHCTDKEILVNSSLKINKKKKKKARAISKNQLSDPGPSWPSCYFFPSMKMLYSSLPVAWHSGPAFDHL